MLDRRELESLGIVMTDEQWKEFCKLDIEGKMWEADHPLDR